MNSAVVPPLASRNVLLACASISPYRMPVCRNTVDFTKCFQSNSHEPEAGLLVRNLNETRELMIRALSSKEIGINEKLDRVNDYLPHIYSLFDSLNNQPPVSIDRPLVFSWTGSYTNQPDVQQFNELIYELAMTLHTKAILHHSYAKHLLEVDFDGSLTLAGQQLLVAAGVMEYLSKTLIPQWLFGVKGSLRPPEISEIVCDAMADIYNAEAQQMAIVKALMKEGGTPPAVITKLCIAYIRTLDRGIDQFARLPVEARDIIDRELVSFSREFVAGLLYFQHAETFRAKNETGIALAYYAEAKSRIIDQTSGLKAARFAALKAKYPTLQLGSGVDILLAQIHAAEEVTSRDNRLVYFLAVPKPSELPELPQGALIMVRKPYEPPRADKFVIFNPTTTGTTSSSSSSSSSVSVPSSPVATTTVRSSTASGAVASPPPAVPSHIISSNTAEAANGSTTTTIPASSSSAATVLSASSSSSAAASPQASLVGSIFSRLSFGGGAAGKGGGNDPAVPTTTIAAAAAAATQATDAPPPTYDIAVGRGGAERGGGGGGADGGPKSDFEIARELQRRLDAGENL